MKIKFYDLWLFYLTIITVFFLYFINKNMTVNEAIIGIVRGIFVTIFYLGLKFVVTKVKKRE